jgi:hypothetical protein
MFLGIMGMMMFSTMLGFMGMVMSSFIPDTQMYGDAYMSDAGHDSEVLITMEAIWIMMIEVPTKAALT